MSDQDLHSPTTAGPEPESVAEAVAQEHVPSGTIPPAQQPAPAPPVDEHPEIEVAKAFAGGLVAAVFLRSLARRRHR